MPSSFPDALGVVVSFVQALRPASVLDVGIGFGKYGVLFREYLDVAARPPDEPWDPAARRVRIDGIEAWPPYVTALQRAVYDTVYTGEAGSLLATLPVYDLVFAADVLEHFDRPAGEAFLALALARARLGVLVVTPALEITQAAVFGNPWEVHRSVWRVADFARRPGADVLVSGRQLVAYLPADGCRRRLPRPSLRQAAGALARAWLVRALGPVRAELWLARLRGER
jgi:hypothetical protein